MPASQNSANNQKSDPNIDVTTPYTPRIPAPIVSISLNNPVGNALRKIKNFLTHKQTLLSTTFSIKVTPIVAMVSLFGVATLFGGGITTAYNFGKTVEEKFLTSTPSPTPKVVVIVPAEVTESKAGIVKATYLLTVPLRMQSQEPEIIYPENTSIPPSTGSGDILPSPTPSPMPSPTPQPVLHYLLTGYGSPIFLSPANSINLKKYLNLRVLITGVYDKSTNTLKIAQERDIEVLE